MIFIPFYALKPTLADEYFHCLCRDIAAQTRYESTRKREVYLSDKNSHMIIVEDRKMVKEIAYLFCWIAGQPRVHIWLCGKVEILVNPNLKSFSVMEKELQEYDYRLSFERELQRLETESGTPTRIRTAAMWLLDKVYSRMPDYRREYIAELVWHGMYAALLKSTVKRNSAIAAFERMPAIYAEDKQKASDIAVLLNRFTGTKRAYVWRVIHHGMNSGKYGYAVSFKNASSPQVIEALRIESGISPEDICKRYLKNTMKDQNAPLECRAIAKWLLAAIFKEGEK